jgi:hypothetical protein
MRYNYAVQLCASYLTITKQSSLNLARSKFPTQQHKFFSLQVVKDSFEVKMSESVSIKELESALQCPACNHLPRSTPIYQCESGHILCTNCRIRLSKCPTCQMSVGQTRSLFAEKMLQKIPLPCRFEIHGCQTKALMNTQPRFEKMKQVFYQK